MSYWQETITIGSLKIPRFIGGPLDGITDAPFRQLVREFSPTNLLYTEMRHVATVVHSTSRINALDFLQFERPLSFQVSANSTDFIAQAVANVMRIGVDIIDVNIGCPARNVCKNGAGSALMADLPRLELILKTFRACVPIGFTVKIRAGYKTENAVEVARLAQDCGVDAIAIHPRLQTQRFLGRPDYRIASRVKQAVSVPVLLSGNIVNWPAAKLAYEQTGADGYLIGRGMWAKPWKLKELEFQAQGKSFEISQTEMIMVAIKQLDSMLAYYGPHGLYMYRKHVPFYLRGFENASAIRQRVVSSNSYDEVRALLASLTA